MLLGEVRRGVTLTDASSCPAIGEMGFITHSRAQHCFSGTPGDENVFLARILFHPPSELRRCCCCSYEHFRQRSSMDDVVLNTINADSRPVAKSRQIAPSQPSLFPLVYPATNQQRRGLALIEESIGLETSYVYHHTCRTATPPSTTSQDGVGSRDK